MTAAMALLYKMAAEARSPYDGGRYDGFVRSFCQQHLNADSVPALTHALTRTHTHAQYPPASERTHELKHTHKHAQPEGVFNFELKQTGYDHYCAQVKLNWSSQSLKQITKNSFGSGGFELAPHRLVF